MAGSKKNSKSTSSNKVSRNTNSTSSPPSGGRTGRGQPTASPATPDPKAPPAKESRARVFSQQYLPYLWGALGLFLVVCFVLDILCQADTYQEHWMGFIGFYLCRGLFGLFGWAALLLSPVFFMMAVSWRRYCRQHMVGLQVLLSLLFMLLVSAFVHVCVCSSDAAMATVVNPAELFRTGADWKSGGVLGGLLGWLLYRGLRLAGTLVLMIVTLPLIIMFLVGVTPVEVFSRLWAHIRAMMAAHKEKKQLRQTEKAEEQAAALEEKKQAAATRARAQAREREKAQRAQWKPKEDDPEDDSADKAPADTVRVDSVQVDSIRVDANTGEVLDDHPEEDAPEGAPDRRGEDDTRAHPTAKRKTHRLPVGGTVPEEDEPEDSPVPDEPVNSVTVEATGADAEPESDAEGELFRPVSPVRATSAVRRASHMEIDLEPEEGMDVPPAGQNTDTDTETDTATDTDTNTDAGVTPEPDEEDPLAELPIRGSGHRTKDAKPVDAVAPNGKVPGEPEASDVDGTSSPKDAPSPAATAAGSEKDSPDSEEPPPPSYVFPPLELLTRGSARYETNEEEILKGTRTLRATLESFHIRVKDITCSCGPTVTRYEVKPDVGVRVRSIANLVDDIALGLAKTGVRIEAPIPGKSAVGIEVPNDHPATVYLRNLLETSEFQNHKSRVAACLGAEVSGRPVIFDINKMPHLLISGTTGSGKSVCINCIILSILYKAKPEEVKLILIDPKKVEFNVYRGIPHLYCPIVTDPKKAAGALYSAVAEMERRFELIEEVGVRNLTGYNEVTAGDPEHPPMPQMIIIIDELADLMMTAPTEVESAICRLAQKARAAGIHLILGTQRPSVDVITGLIKANIPSRIAFTVKSQVDSRTIIDIAGAEKLIGRGDMLYAPVGATKPLRVQGAFVSDGEVEEVVTFVKEHNEKPVYDESFTHQIDVEAAKCGKKKSDESSIDDFEALDSDGEDPKFWEAVEVAVSNDKVSTSLLQRRAGLGYGRAAKIIDRMEQLGFVGPADGNKPRKLLITAQDFAEMKMNGFKRPGGEE